MVYRKDFTKGYHRVETIYMALQRGLGVVEIVAHTAPGRAVMHVEIVQDLSITFITHYTYQPELSQG